MPSRPIKWIIMISHLVSRVVRNPFKCLHFRDLGIKSCTLMLRYTNIIFELSECVHYAYDMPNILHFLIKTFYYALNAFLYLFAIFRNNTKNNGELTNSKQIIYPYVETKQPNFDDSSHGLSSTK